MKKITLIPVAFILAAAVLLVSCNSNSNNEAPAPSGTPAAKTTGILSDFESVDINNNKVDQSLFKGKKLTMVNIWATFCSNCIDNMPYFDELNETYREKGVQIIGIPVDVADRNGDISPEMLDTAKEILSKTGVTYLQILPSESLMQAKLGRVSSVPETIFVDENGRQVGKSFIGARSKEQWRRIIDDLLRKVE